MLLEERVFNFSEVNEKSMLDIRNECLIDFAYKLKELLEADEGTEEVQVDWDKPVCNKKVKVSGRNWGTWNYKYFQDCFSSKIKYNTKSIIFEETVTNNTNNGWNVKDTCSAVYGLEWVEGTENHSGYFRYPKHEVAKLTHPNYCCVVENKEHVDEVTLENIRRFYEFFGLGEFPFITITVIRLGNKDHYFYRIHR